MDRRQTARVEEFIAAADLAIASASGDRTASREDGAYDAFKSAYRVIERERFLPPEVLTMASTIRSTLLNAHSHQVLAEVELLLGRAVTPEARRRWADAIDEAKVAVVALRDALGS